MANYQRRGSYGRSNNNRGRSDFKNRSFNEGPPAEVVAIGCFLHECEGDIVIKANLHKVPYFNAQIYLENKISIGKVDEIFGPLNNYMFSVKLSQGYCPSSFKKEQNLYIDPNKLLPLSRFLPAIPNQNSQQGFSNSVQKSKKPQQSSSNQQFNRGRPNRGAFRTSRTGRYGARSYGRSRGR